MTRRDPLLVLVPSRGRPQSLTRVAACWEHTGAFDQAKLVFVVDSDDSRFDEYCAEQSEHAPQVTLMAMPSWQPLVPKLNAAALAYAQARPMLAFMGDDHLPRTPGWAGRYADELRRMGTGIVYGNDLLQGENLPTQWAMTSNIVRALGRMVPAPVDHLYCDNAIKLLGEGAGCLKYLPDVTVEHVHPIAGKTAWDEQYRQVNSPERYTRDGQAFSVWVADRMHDDIRAIRELRRDT